MDIKKSTLLTYEKIADKYENNTQAFRDDYILDDLDSFLEKLQGKQILDIGSGGGRDSLYFLSKGFNPLCLDFSKKMIELCKSKGLKGRVCDFEEMNFENNSFDGIWSYTSLLHIPKKNLPSVLGNIYRILKNNGIFFISMKEGKGEYLKTVGKYGKDGRYALYEENELISYLSDAGFEILNTSIVKHKLGSVYIGVMCKK